MTHEPLSPELALVDPDLAARARAALPMPATGPPRRSEPGPAAAPTLEPSVPRAAESSHPYPLWARATAAMWLVVVGILIGGAAIPHAQDKPRIVPNAEETTVCKPDTAPVVPPGTIKPVRPGA